MEFLASNDLAHGIDFGGYTVWRRPDNPSKPIDFVICGVAWGKNSNTTFEQNIEAVKAERRRMTYGFYHTLPDPKKQAEKWLVNSDMMNSQFIWVDVERSARSPIHIRPGFNAERIWTIVEWLQARTLGDKVGIYANFNDYGLIDDYEFPFHELPFWLAWPDNDPAPPGGTDRWWLTIKRQKHDNVFDQYSWKGDGPAFGTVNGKKSIDLNVSSMTPAELDVWLGITDAPPAPPVGEIPPELVAQIESVAYDKAIQAIERLKG